MHWPLPSLPHATLPCLAAILNRTRRGPRRSWFHLGSLVSSWLQALSGPAAASCNSDWRSDPFGPCITARCGWSKPPGLKDKIAYALGAELVEVRVNRRTYETRVPRLSELLTPIESSTCAPHAAGYRPSDLGMSSTLLEATEFDERYARYVNFQPHGLSLPVNADRADRVNDHVVRTGR